MGTVSLYLRDDVLERLDQQVERAAKLDRLQGRTGRDIANRSRYIERLLERHLDQCSRPTMSEIREVVVDLAQEYGAQKVSLFGSYARGDETDASDIDVLLEKGDIRGLRVLDFQDELAHRLGRSVDVVTTAGASDRFLEKIRKDEQVLYEAS